MNAKEALKDLPLARISKIAAAVNGDRVKRHKDKATALKAVGKVSKQRLALALAQTGGVKVEELEELFGVRRAYARDMIAKLTAKGVEFSKSDEGAFTASL